MGRFSIRFSTARVLLHLGYKKGNPNASYTCNVALLGVKISNAKRVSSSPFVKKDSCDVLNTMCTNIEKTVGKHWYKYVTSESKLKELADAMKAERELPDTGESDKSVMVYIAGYERNNG